MPDTPTSTRSPPTPSTSEPTVVARNVPHVPATPSRLRQAINMSPQDGNPQQDEQNEEMSPSTSPEVFVGRGRRSSVPYSSIAEYGGEDLVSSLEPDPVQADARTRLLEDYHRSNINGSRPSGHDTFTPRARPSLSPPNSFDSTNSFRDHYRNNYRVDGPSTDGSRGVFADSVAALGDRALTTTKWLSKEYGIKSNRYLYLSYYFPFMKWIRQYKWRFLRGDLIAAITMASFYIPMSLSYASNLGHVPPINGLYSFVFNPIIYAFLGSCPQMVVGPEAAGSLLVGTVVQTCIDRGQAPESDDVLHAQIAGVVTGIAGGVIFVAGLTRLGFLDSVLSRPFLRGFISAIGFVIIVDQLIPELGLSEVAKTADGVVHGSSAAKILFLFQNVGKSHKLTTAVSMTSFAIIMIFRELKRRLQPRFPSVAYFPDRFLVVALSAVLAWKFDWDKKGLDVLGTVRSSGKDAFPFHWPYQFSHMKHIDTALSTSFLIALLGFFESSVAAKSLGEGTHELHGMSLSANRELIALGTANIVGGMFMALPAFGGYGRSKVNAATGGTTPMSSIILSAITLICILFLLPSFYYLPKGVLSAMVTVVAYSLIEECPHDLRFFIKIRGWTELLLMSIIFLATVFYSLSLGIALGIGLSLLKLIRHATKPRIQILGKVPGTTDKFENAEYYSDNIEYIEGCLIVKVPEPLTFANTGELKTRLRRLEHYGAYAAHPSLPRIRHDYHNKNIVFDVHGVTSIDGSGTQVLSEIVEAYVKRDVRVFFCRLPQRRSKVWESFERSGIVEMCGGTRNFVESVEEALKLSEVEDLESYFDERMDGA